MSRKEVFFMKNRKYNSIYGLNIEQFIDMKLKLGYVYRTFSTILFQLDRFAEQTKETSSGITKEFAEKWSERLPNEGEFYRYRRVRLLAQFSSYLCDFGVQSYIPKLLPHPKSTFIPYIYSPQEIDTIFRACDELRLKVANMNSCLFCFPVLIRLLYSTGVRISEALALGKDDINLIENYLLVKDSKNRKQRIIPISTSLASVCKEYVCYRDQIPLNQTKIKNFFVNTNGNSPSSGAILARFKECLAKAGIPYIGGGQGPRIHDMRHTFAVTSLANMAEAGIDLYASMPILSNYLGHQSFDSTNQYVRLTSSMYPSLLKDIDKVCFDMFPKFNNYETD
ncbi:tyrosine-type recombinase/integrase [Flavobacterium psychroterrae]|uniref:Tyrosine-type recombinase/integrase n=2 Tax=Flavobacterium psychroterrae TaxID=2133767 RepID=A0ABS5PK35_9FLAO|nr:tyrosine-type recombinase/integrase [Flavobacterium psychroterrae]